MAEPTDGSRESSPTLWLWEVNESEEKELSGTNLSSENNLIADVSTECSS